MYFSPKLWVQYETGVLSTDVYLIQSQFQKKNGEIVPWILWQLLVSYQWEYDVNWKTHDGKK